MIEGQALRAVAVVLAAMSVAGGSLGCRTAKNSDDFEAFVAEHRDYVFLGMVSSDFGNEPHKVVSHPGGLELVAAGIDYFVGAGSVIYELWVEPSRQDDAARILERHHIKTSSPPRVNLGYYLQERDFHIELHNRWRRGDCAVGTLNASR